MADPYDRLVAEGKTVLEEWCSDGREEDLYLEFKQKSGLGPGLSEDDKKNLYRAVSAFANADGGMVVWGVRTERKSGIDRATELKPISNLQKFCGHLIDCLANATSSPVQGIEVIAIPSASGADCGYVAMRIPQSMRRPHQASSHQKYYRRTTAGTRPMDHYEIQDMVLGATHAVLHPEWHLEVRSISGNVRSMLARISLRNASGIMTAFPFMLVKTNKGGVNFYNEFSRSSAVPHPEGYRAAYGGAENVLHAYDVSPIVFFHISFRLSESAEVEGIAFSKSPDHWVHPDHFQPLRLDLRFGGERAVHDERIIEITSADLIRRFEEIPEAH